MKLEVLVVGDYVEKVFINNENVKCFTDILKEFALSKGYNIRFDEYSAFLYNQKHDCAEEYLEKISNISNDDNMDNFCGVKFEWFKQKLNELIDELKEKMENLKNEKIVVIELN